MIPLNLRRAAIAVLAGAMISGCTSTWGSARLEAGGQPPITGIPDEEAADLAKCDETTAAVPASRGSGATAEAPAFGGLLRAADEPPGQSRERFVLHVHGMGDTPRCGFTRALLGPLEAAGYQRLNSDTDWRPAETVMIHNLRGEGLNCAGAAAAAIPCRYDRFGEYRVDRYRGPAGDSLTVYTYYWHRDMWQVQYRYLAEDLKHDRGLIGSPLKNETVDKGLGDAAGYLGPMGEPLRDALGVLTCRMLRDALHIPYERRPLRMCLDASELARFRDSGVEFNFLTHSLGSRMLFDALEPAAGQGAGGFLADHTRTFFMAANQLPLLGVGRLNHDPEPRSSGGGVDVAAAAITAPDAAAVACGQLPAFLAARCLKSFPDKRLTDDPANRLDVVAFIDPGDLLGFRANGSVRDGYYGDVRFFNVIHRNTPEIAFLGSWPLWAHDRELDSRSATRLILCGARKTADGRLKARLCPANPGR